MKITYNKPYTTGLEIQYIADAIKKGHLSGNGYYTKKCQDWFVNRYSFQKSLLTTSCTDALEMSSILLNLVPGDEIIMPCYTFVSTANAFALRGAKIRFVDSHPNNPNLDESKIEELINKNTKAVVVVHYAGISCNMDRIMEICERNKLILIEDAAQAIDNFFTDKNGKKLALGSLGDLATFSFHETKNIQCGEGGLLIINNNKYLKRSEIIWEKGTNRSSFFRGEIDKYGWVDIGSSFLPSEINAAFLWSQLEELSKIQSERLLIWNKYYNSLQNWAEINNVKLPEIPSYSGLNAHIFYLVFQNFEIRQAFIKKKKNHDIQCVFHYQSLNQSSYYKSISSWNSVKYPNSDKFSECLVRLPIFVGLDVDIVIKKVFEFNGI